MVAGNQYIHECSPIPIWSRYDLNGANRFISVSSLLDKRQILPPPTVSWSHGIGAVPAAAFLRLSNSPLQMTLKPSQVAGEQKGIALSALSFARGRVGVH
jgi:hypothetical protein